MNMRKMSRSLATVAVAGLLAVSSVARASVAVDASTGVGFVGTGDVQTAFGWNNAQLQNKAGGVTFTFDSEDTYLVTAEWETGNPNSPHGTTLHTITVPRHTSVKATVAYDPRVKNQITGFNLKGFTSWTSTGTIPMEGDNFNDGNDVKIITHVELISSSGGSGLQVNYGTSHIPLPNTPVL
jgi:hypothetical protein